MSYFDYAISKEIEKLRPSFMGIIMGAMRKADDDNLKMLKKCWPGVFEELHERYWSPGGTLKGEE